MADDLLPRRPFAVLPPEAGGFEEALRRGRRRRYRNTGSGVLASVVALALAFTLTGTNPDTDARIEIADTPTHVEDDRVRPGPGDGDDGDAVVADQLDDVAQPDAEGATTDDRSQGDDDETGGAEVSAPGEQPRAGAVPKTSSSTRGRRVKPPTETHEPDGYLPCSATGVLTVTELWCLSAEHAITDSTDGDALLTLRVCLSPQAASARRLSFDGEQQVDFAVRRAGTAPVIWQWSHRAVFGTAPTSDPVSPGACRAYAVEWLERSDNAGYYVENGEYELTATTLAAELGSENSATYRFTLTGQQ